MRARFEGDSGSKSVTELRERVTLALWASLMAVMPWLWRPGLIAPDTKLDLLTNPWGYLERALTPWDVLGGFGQLQNQAYGYLLPMGPFFGVGQAIGIPEWAIQRGWWSVVLVVAFLGAERALRVLGVGTGLSAALPAVAYALSPRLLTVLSEISVEAWPAAVCPWLVVVLVPALRAGATTADRARMMVSTALLMAMVGGVNAAASLLVVLVPAVLILTGSGRTDRVRTSAWWVLGVCLGSAWWLVPLVVLGAYAFPFLDFIETASVTTSVTSLPNVLRGTSHWQAYLIGPDRQPQWQAGWVLVQHPLAMVGTLTLAGLGIAGVLMRRDDDSGGGGIDAQHVRRFCLTSILLGVALMSAGHAARFGGGFADTVQSLLDGPLAPFRNVHKADPLIRLPITIGICWLLPVLPGRFAAWLWPNLSERDRSHSWRRWVLGTVVATLVAATLPVWQGRVVSAGAFDALPQYWQRAATIVDDAAAEAGGATLLLPASRAGTYAWGSPGDEPLAALATSPVVVRDAVSLGAPEATRILDVVDQMAASGTEQQGLASTLSRMGVARIVVRHDLAGRSLAEDPALVERTLALSPGFARLARLRAPEVGTQLSVWEVEGDVHPVTAYGTERVLRVSGGPEAMATLSAAGVPLDDRLVVVGDDAIPESGTASEEGVSTDTLRLRRLNTGNVIADAYSQTLDRLAGQRGRPVKDLPPAGQGNPETTRIWHGLESVTASDEASDPFKFNYRGPHVGAFAAIDEDPETFWLSSGTSATASLRLEFNDQVPTSAVHLRFAEGPGIGEVQRVVVSAGGLRVAGTPTGQTMTLPLTGGDGSVLEIELRSRSESRRGTVPVGLADVKIDGHEMGTSIRAAHPELGAASAYVLARDSRERLDPPRAGEDGAPLERTLSVDRATSMRAEVSVVARDGQALEELLDDPWTVTASSRIGAGPSNRPGAAIDGMGTTRWIAEVGDLAPRLELRADTPQRVSSLTVRGGDRKRIAAIQLQSGESVVRLGRAGGRFPQLRSRDLTIIFQLRDSDSAFVSPELSLGAGPVNAPVTLGCGEAGELVMNGHAIPLRLTTSRSALLRGIPSQADPCGSPELDLLPGATPVTVLPGPAVQASSVVLANPGAFGTSSASDVQNPSIEEWTESRRAFTVEPGAAQVVAFHEGFNPGWQATIDGRPLDPIRVDGWRQGFVVDAGAGGLVRAVFVPAPWYSRGLLAGGILVGLLVVAAVVMRRGSAPVRAHAALRSARPAPRWAPVAGALAAALLLFAVGGYAGVLILFVVGLSISWGRRRSSARIVLALLLVTGPLLLALDRIDRDQLGRDLAQLLGLAVVSVLAWTLIPPRARHEGPLEEEVGERGHEDAPGQGDDQHGPEVAREDPPVTP